MEESIRSSQFNISQQNFYAGFKACLPTVLGYLSIGFAAGVIEKTAGLSLAEITLLSVILYAGSAQFVITAMIATGNPLSSILFTVFFINLRHLLLSASLAPYFQKLSLGKHFLIGALITDETFGVAILQGLKDKTIPYYWMIGLNITAYLNWIFANILGGLCGSMITDFKKYGIDFALAAMFAGLLVFQILGEKSKIKLYLMIVAVTVAVFFITSAILPGIWSIILSAVIASTIGLFVEKKSPPPRP
ncbi:AzlC family ABC transporter permease [soil metagenome]